MSTRLALISLLPLVLSTGALAQNPNLFGNLLVLFAQQVAHAEWQKIPTTEAVCINQQLASNGRSIDWLIARGILPSDPTLLRSIASCRKQVAEQVPGVQVVQPSAQTLPYIVDGLALGSRVRFDSAVYKEYRCKRSDFEGLIWCHKQKAEQGSHGQFISSNSILHTQDGRALYINRSIEPAFFSFDEVRTEINRLSDKFGETARVTRMPQRLGLPDAVIACWGSVKLEALDAVDTHAIGLGSKPQRKGVFISFLGDIQKSARLNLPIFRLEGGAGFVWSASLNADGRGVLRFLAIDFSGISPQASIAGGPSGLDINNATQNNQPAASHTEGGETQKGKNNEEQARTIVANADPSALQQNQTLRDMLFTQLKAQSPRYHFDYIVINLPPGTIPGVNASVPVSHIRYSDTVFFAFNKFALQPSAEGVIGDFAKTILKDKSFRSILVVGHTDSIGSDAYNFDLSKSRAATVATALRAAGIRDQLLGIVPMGKGQPLETNSTDAGRARNRRVEFFISDFPEASMAAIKGIKFNPCNLIDHQIADVSSCPQAETNVPVLPSSGEGRPLATLDLSRSAIPSIPISFREPLPSEILQRPSIKELQ